MSFTQLSNGQTHSFGGRYLDLIPGELIRNTDRFDEEALPGEMITTVRLTAMARVFDPVGFIGRSRHSKLISKYRFVLPQRWGEAKD